MAVNWNALMSYPDAGQAFKQSFEQGMKKRQQDYLAKQFEQLDGPNRQEALRRIYAQNPELGMRAEDQLYQRDERSRAADFRTGAANMLLGGSYGPQTPVGGTSIANPAAPNALAAVPPSPGALPTNTNDMTAPPADSPQPATAGGSAPAGGERHPAFAALDPHLDSIRRGAELIRRINPTDDASWNNVRSEAGQLGIDLTDVPKKFNASYVKALLQIADHPELGGAQPQQAAPQSGNSGDFERMVRADPEKFLTFQGKQTQVTAGRLKVAQAINEGAMQILGGVHDQATYDAAKEASRALYGQYGEDFSAIEQGLPAEYSPELIHDLQMRGMNTSHQLQQVVRENKLENDIADDTADNARADRNTASLISTRQQGLALRNKPKPGRAPAAPKAPTPSTVIGGIMAKQAGGQPLSAAEQQTLAEYRASQHAPRKGGVSAGSNAVIVNPKTGQRMQLQNGQWVPIK